MVLAPKAWGYRHSFPRHCWQFYAKQIVERRWEKKIVPRVFERNWDLMLIHQVLFVKPVASGEVKRVRRKLSALLFVSRALRQPPVRRLSNASSAFASPRLRQSLAALDSGYGLNENPKTANGKSLRQPGPRASPRFGSAYAE